MAEFGQEGVVVGRGEFEREVEGAEGGVGEGEGGEPDLGRGEEVVSVGEEGGGFEELF